MLLLPKSFPISDENLTHIHQIFCSSPGSLCFGERSRSALEIPAGVEMGLREGGAEAYFENENKMVGDQWAVTSGFVGKRHVLMGHVSSRVCRYTALTLGEMGKGFIVPPPPGPGMP